MPIDGPTPNQPASGTQGQQSQVDALKKAIGLPPPSQPQQGPPPVSPTPAGAKPAVPGGPFGLPSAITAPTNQPNVPASQPLLQPINPVAQAQGVSDKNRALLQMLMKSPDVNPTTRQWAALVLKKYDGT